MQTYYEKILNGLQRPILLVAVSIVALLSASAVAMGVTSTEGRNEAHAVKATAATPTSTAFRYVTVTIPPGPGTKTIKNLSARFNSPVTSSVVVLNGFKLDYQSVDHHTDTIEVDAIQTGTNPADTVNFSLRVTHDDKNADDSYTGSVTVAVIANVQ